MEKKLVIGIPGYKQQSSDGFGVGNEYLEYASTYGDVRIIMPHEVVAEDIDVLLLVGGMDLNPTSYGDVPSFSTSNQDVFKQFFYDKRLSNYIGKVPIIGICLGMQQLAAYFGSKLTQNLVYHAQSTANWAKGHKAFTMPFDGTKPKEIEINSHHHQGILKENLHDSLQAILVGGNEEYGILPNREHLYHYKQIIEGFKHTSLPIYGFQFHPERGYAEFPEEVFWNNPKIFSK